MTPIRHQLRRLGRGARTALLGACALATTLALAQSNDGCGPLENNFGPYDYRDYKDAPAKNRDSGESSPLFLVESAHFLDTCEAMVYCAAGTPGREFDYTLRAFPNHHRALVAMMRLAARTKTEKAVDARYTVSCYFNRAMRWRPDDIVVRLIYVVYLNDNGRTELARQQVREAQKLNPENPYSLYNLGMVALDVNEVDIAVESARKAYAAGMAQPMLKQRLVAIKRWTDADEQASQPGAAASAPGAPASAPPAATAASAPAPAASR
ncbi:hypothetical protein CDN99_00700 [Roseateles aquatilis]|uniref:Uncharacterized protein n=1 Tax=Roseateles aquatilis TaxID=431061 RepID=A0A246JLI3_9BURK|nr:hypothetical protein [Roseateles aquatilis]OWQ93059.1 hypothetical protein CDN99_00700 [Roseateles aquatilis]